MADNKSDGRSPKSGGEWTTANLTKNQEQPQYIIEIETKPIFSIGNNRIVSQEIPVVAAHEKFLKENNYAFLLLDKTKNPAESFSPQQVAQNIFDGKAGDLEKIGEFLGEVNPDTKKPDAYIQAVLTEYAKLSVNSDVPFAIALRSFLDKFKLPGEAQKIDRLMEVFAKGYHEKNKNQFSNEGEAYITAFATIMLATDLHNPEIKTKMTKEKFVNNTTQSYDKGTDVKLLLEEIYDNIQQKPLALNIASPQTQKPAFTAPDEPSGVDQAKSKIGMLLKSIMDNDKREMPNEKNRTYQSLVDLMKKLSQIEKEAVIVAIDDWVVSRNANKEDSIVKENNERKEDFVSMLKQDAKFKNQKKESEKKISSINQTQSMSPSSSVEGPSAEEQQAAISALVNKISNISTKGGKISFQYNEGLDIGKVFEACQEIMGHDNVKMKNHKSGNSNNNWKVKDGIIKIKPIKNFMAEDLTKALQAKFATQKISANLAETPSVQIQEPTQIKSFRELKSEEYKSKRQEAEQPQTRQEGRPTNIESGSRTRVGNQEQQNNAIPRVRNRTEVNAVNTPSNAPQKSPLLDSWVKANTEEALQQKYKEHRLSSAKNPVTFFMLDNFKNAGKLLRSNDGQRKDQIKELSHFIAAEMKKPDKSDITKINEIIIKLGEIKREINNNAFESGLYKLCDEKQKELQTIHNAISQQKKQEISSSANNTPQTPQTPQSTGNFAVRDIEKRAQNNVEKQRIISAVVSNLLDGKTIYFHSEADFKKIKVACEAVNVSITFDEKNRSILLNADSVENKEEIKQKLISRSCTEFGFEKIVVAPKVQQIQETPTPIRRSTPEPMQPGINAELLCQTSGWCNNCGLNCLTHFLYSKLESNELQSLVKSDPGKYAEYQKLLVTFQEYYQLPVTPNWNDVKQILGNLDSPQDREFVMAPVLRVHLGKVMAKNIEISIQSELSAAMSTHLDPTFYSDRNVVGPLIDSNITFFNQLKEGYKASIEFINDLQNNPIQPEERQNAENKLISKQKSSDLNIRNKASLTPENIHKEVMFARKNQVLDECKRDLDKYWKQQPNGGFDSYIKYVSNLENQVMVSADQLQNLCNDLNIKAEIYMSGSDKEIKNAEGNFPMTMKVYNSGLHWQYEEPNGNINNVRLHNSDYNGSRQNTDLNTQVSITKSFVTSEFSAVEPPTRPKTHAPLLMFSKISTQQDAEQSKKVFSIQDHNVNNIVNLPNVGIGHNANQPNQYEIRPRNKDNKHNFSCLATIMEDKSGIVYGASSSSSQVLASKNRDKYLKFIVETAFNAHFENQQTKDKKLIITISQNMSPKDQNEFTQIVKEEAQSRIKNKQLSSGALIELKSFDKQPINLELQAPKEKRNMNNK